MDRTHPLSPASLRRISQLRPIWELDRILLGDAVESNICPPAKPNAGLSGQDINSSRMRDLEEACPDWTSLSAI